MELESASNGSDLNKYARLNENSKIVESNEADDDELLNELLDEEIPAHIREARLNELKMKAREQQYMQKNNHSIYHDLTEEEFLKTTTQTKKCIVHFYHPDFKRCEVMHAHLLKLAHNYMDVKFAKINAEKAKFFVKKLNIQVLPAVLCFVDGILKNRIIGFEQFGNGDNFETRSLEKYLWKLKFLKKPDHEYDSDGEANGSDEEKNVKKSSIRSGATLNKHSRDEDSD